MSDIKHEIVFPGGGLNYDDDPKWYQVADAPYRLNILVGEDGTNGVITNMRGNKVVEYALGSANLYLTIGSCYDVLNRCVYYWVFSQPYDTTGSDDYEYDNRLLRFNEDSETIDTIFIDTKNYFGLHYNYPMKDPFIMGDQLYFNPRVSEPKVIDVVRAYNYTNYDAYDEYSTYILGDKRTYFGGLFMANTTVALGETPITNSNKWDRIGDSYQNFSDLNEDSEFRYAFNVLRHIPVYRLIGNYNSDTTFTSNNLRGIIGRFSHRYRYFDNTFSRYSAYSDVTLPNYNERYNGEIPNETTFGNCIDIVIPLHSPALIKEIEIVYQIIGENWKRIKIINRQDIELLDKPTYIYRFYNNETYPEVPNDDVKIIYDSVPRTAECQEIINKNILCYGYVKEGFDNIDKNDIQVTLTGSLQAISILEGVSAIIRDGVAEGDIFYYAQTASGWYANIEFIDWSPIVLLQAGDIYVIQINGITAQYTIQAGDIAGTDTDFVVALGNALTLLLPGFYFDPSTDPSYVALRIQFFNTLGQSFFYRPSGAPTTELTKYRDFKSGAHHPFCLFYYDGVLRRWDAQVSKGNIGGVIPYTVEGTTLFLPTLNECNPLPASTAYKWVIDWEVNHTPPAGAKYWRWGYAGNSLCSWFVQYTAESISASVPGDGEPLNTIKINIRPLQTIATATDEDASWNEFPQTNIAPYDWIRGDRVRFITEDKNGANMGAVIDGLYDYEILQFDIENHYIFITDDFDFATVVGGTGESALIEIYRPRKADSEVEYYEFGEIYPIIEDVNGVLLHGGQTQNQDVLLSEPATGRFDAGDIYRIIRTPSKPISTIVGYFHESLWYSDFYDSDDYDRGKIGYETTFGERYLNIVRNSKQYLQNTRINGLSTFDGLDYKELNDVYGKIMRIIEIGDTLKVYQRKKPSSILIGRTEYVDAAGNSNIVQTSDRILGAIRYSNTNYGTEFPESICKNNRYVYGFDIYNGVFWRDSANGIFPISGRYENPDGSTDYKMDSYFKEKAKDLLLTGVDYCDVITVWDERYKNLYVTFKDYITEANDETIVFHEPSNRWICFTEFFYTPANGWNQILELDYEVVRGFDAGIGFSFDEDTRFALFNIGDGLGSGDSIYINQPLQSPMLISIPQPAITCTANVSPSQINLVLTNPIPVTHVSYISLSDDTMIFTANESGSGDAQSSTVNLVVHTNGTLTSTRAWIESMSKWISVSSGKLLGVDDPITDGAVLSIYPTAANTGSQKDGTIVIRDVYGNYATIYITHQAPVANPVVNIQIHPDDTAGLILVSGTGSCNFPNTAIDLTFTVNHPSRVYGQQYMLYWSITRKVGLADPTGDNSGAWEGRDGILDEVSNTRTIQLNSASIAAELITVYLSASAYTPPVTTVNASVSPATIGMIITIPDPVVYVSSIAVDDHSMTWTALEGGEFADAQSTTFTVVGAGNYATLLSKPDWVTVVDASDNELFPGDEIADAETIYLYPSEANDTAPYRPPDYGAVYFTDIDGNGDYISVTHSATTAAPYVDIQNHPEFPYGSDGSTEFELSGTSGTAVSGSTEININFVPYDSALLDYVGYSLFYEIWKPVAGVSTAVGSGRIDNVLNNVSNSFTLYMSTAAEDGDPIIVFLRITT